MIVWQPRGNAAVLEGTQAQPPCVGCYGVELRAESPHDGGQPPYVGCYVAVRMAIVARTIFLFQIHDHQKRRPRWCRRPSGILVNNAGGPPPGDFRDFTHDMWIAALEANMLTPIELIKATVDGMISRKFGRIVNITSSAVKAPIDILGLSNGARTGLTGFVAGIARKTVAHNVTIDQINFLCPRQVLGSTALWRAARVAAAKMQGKPVEEVHAARMKTVPAGRFGNP